MNKKFKVCLNKINELDQQCYRTKVDLDVQTYKMLKEIKSNPFLRRKWTFLDKLFFKITGTPIPKTDYQKALTEVYKTKKKVTRMIDQNYNVSLNLIREWYKK